MKKSTLLICVAGLVAPFIVKHYYNEFCKKAGEETLDYIKKEVENERSEETLKLIEADKELASKADDILKREEYEIRELVSKAIASEGLESKKIDIAKKTADAIDSYKKEISYDERLKRIKKVAEDELNSYKETVDYDKTLKALREKKKTAEETYSKQLATLRLTIGSGNTGYSEMKSAFKNERNRIVEEAEDSIKKMEEKLKDREVEVNDRLSKKVAELKEELSVFEDKATALRDEEIGKINEQIRIKSDDIRTQITNRRSDEERDLIQKAATSKSKMKKIADEEIAKIDDRVNTIAKEKVLAIYLTNHGWTIPKVIFVAAIPLVAWGYIANKYCEDVKRLIRAMKELKGETK